jgi:hypothetical protein
LVHFSRASHPARHAAAFVISNIAHFTGLGKPLPTVPAHRFGQAFGGEISAAWAKINSRFEKLFSRSKNRGARKSRAGTGDSNDF